MSRVFVLGAGASYGDSLEPTGGAKQTRKAPGSPPPLIAGFFRRSLYQALGYDPSQAEADYEEVFRYARNTLGIHDQLGEGKWESLDLEDLFTSIEVHREFSAPESDEFGRLLVIRNKLARYVQRILGFCTSGTFGKHSRSLVSKLTMEDSVITFNYDLLIDQEFYRLEPTGKGEFAHYENFQSIVLGAEAGGLLGPSGAEGLYLKLHGSLNWSRCTNPSCPRSSALIIDRDVPAILDLRMGIGERRCSVCDGELAPLLIPPLVDKPIVENPAIRASWGLARKRLTQASTVVVIGYSAPPTDFRSKWLLRSTVGARKDVQVIVVDPANGKDEFKARLETVFPLGYDDNFKHFCEIEDIFHRIRS